MRMKKQNPLLKNRWKRSNHPDRVEDYFIENPHLLDYKEPISHNVLAQKYEYEGYKPFYKNEQTGT